MRWYPLAMIHFVIPSDTFETHPIYPTKLFAVSNVITILCQPMSCFSNSFNIALVSSLENEKLTTCWCYGIQHHGQLHAHVGFHCARCFPLRGAQPSEQYFQMFTFGPWFSCLKKICQSRQINICIKNNFLGGYLVFTGYRVGALHRSE